MEDALAILADGMRSGDEKTRLKTAMFLMKLSGLQGFAKPTKPMSEEENFVLALSEALGVAAEELGFRVPGEIDK